jgi:hypothetical protein
MAATAKAVLPERISASEIGTLLFHPSTEVLESLLKQPSFNEEHLLTLLSRKDLPRAILLLIARRRDWMDSYCVKLAVVKHPRSPREVTLRMLKHIYIFDLMQLVFTPGAPAELKRLSEDAILSQRESLALGQRISLARRGSSRVASRLLADRELPVVKAALSNPYLTEQGVATGLLQEGVSGELPFLVERHPRWSVSRLVKQALVRSGQLSLARVMAILAELTANELTDVACDPRVAPNLRAYAARLANARVRRKGGL